MQGNIQKDIGNSQTGQVILAFLPTLALGRSRFSPNRPISRFSHPQNKQMWKTDSFLKCELTGHCSIRWSSKRRFSTCTLYYYYITSTKCDVALIMNEM